MVAKPNIVLIVADDMGYGDFGRFNDGLVNTPTLDSLMDEGVCLTQHYAGSAVCSPSRAALLTGRYPIRTGAVTPQETLGFDRIALDEATIADSFRQSGYATGLIGKWHNGAFDPRFHPNARGFDEFFGFRGGWMDYYNWWVDRNGSIERGDGRYLTDVLTEEAVSFVRRHRDENFFLSMMYNAPHTPIQAPEDVVGKYEERNLSRSVSITYAMIEVMDQGVSKILQAIDDCGIRDNTIVLFTSDNGPAFYVMDAMLLQGGSQDTSRFNCGLNGFKGSVLEGGIRVPMILRWPDGLPGSVERGEFVSFLDWLPTLTNACGVDHAGNKPLDGRDVLATIRGEESGPGVKSFWQWNQYSPIGFHNAAMRDGPWKLVRPELDILLASAEDQRLAQMHEDRDIEYKYHPENVRDHADWPEPTRIVPAPPNPLLFNLETDPYEKSDVASEHPDLAARMLSELESWFEEVESERLNKSPDALVPGPTKFG